jgi:hypothetical protein
VPLLGMAHVANAVPQAARLTLGPLAQPRNRAPPRATAITARDEDVRRRQVHHDPSLVAGNPAAGTADHRRPGAPPRPELSALTNRFASSTRVVLAPDGCLVVEEDAPPVGPGPAPAPARHLASGAPTPRDPVPA